MGNLNPLTVQPRQPLEKQPETAPKAREGASASSVNPLTSQPLDGQQNVTGKAKPSRRTKKPNPLLDPPVLVTAVMILLVVELVLWAAVGWLWWIVINAAAAMLVFAAMLAWRRRGKGGLLDRLMRLAGLPGASPRSGASPKGASKRKPGGASRNPFSRLFGPGRASRPGGDASRAKKPGLFDALRGKRPGASRKPGASGASPGTSSRKSPAGKPSGSTSSSSGGGGGRKKPGRKKGRSLWDDVRDGFNQKRSEPSAKKSKDPKRSDQKPDREEPAVAADDQPTPKQPKQKERHDQAPQQEQEEETPMIRHDEGSSLQRWGRNLKTIAPAIDELATEARKQSDVTDAIAKGVERLATQGENDLPAHPALTAEAEAIAAGLREVRAEEEVRAERLRSLAARAEVLAARYGTQHETDEARLNGERGGRAKERRADVSAAEQDT